MLAAVGRAMAPPKPMTCSATASRPGCKTRPGAGGRSPRTNARTMKTASRTLVKSPPEVWEQLDHPGRMQGLMAALIGRAADVDVYEREEESRLCWKTDGARIEVELAEKGWGTNVSVSAEGAAEATKLEGWLDAVLDELATPQKRPFEGMTDSSSDPEPVAEAKPEPVVEPEPEPEPEPVQAVPEPVAEERVDDVEVKDPPAVEQPPAPDPPRKKRFGFLGF